jgi:hypothetical protein
MKLLYVVPLGANSTLIGLGLGERPEQISDVAAQMFTDRGWNTTVGLDHDKRFFFSRRR